MALLKAEAAGALSERESLEMSKKIVVFNGSPRKGGYTPQLLDEVIRGAQAAAEVEVTRYELNAEGVRGCQGCYYCRTNEGCSIKDDVLAPMYEDIRDADAILFGTPIYYYHITGQSKLWLDRMFPMIAGPEFTPRYPGKKVATLFVQGAADVAENERVIAAMNSYVADFGWELVDSILCGGTSKPDFRLSEELLGRAFAAGRALVK